MWRRCKSFEEADVSSVVRYLPVDVFDVSARDSAFCNRILRVLLLFGGCSDDQCVVGAVGGLIGLTQVRVP